MRRRDQYSAQIIAKALIRNPGKMIYVVDGDFHITPNHLPKNVADLMESGICMAGGGSQLKGLTERVAEETNIKVWLANDPMTCVARGAGRILEDYDNLRRLLVGLERGSTQH